MKRIRLWVLLLSIVGFSGIWSAHATTFNSTNYSINGSLGDSSAGSQTSTNYALTSAAGESVAGNSSSGSYKLGQGYISTLENSLQVNVQPNGLIGNWTFDQGAGSTVVDESVNNTNAQFVGAPTYYGSGKIGQGLTGFNTSNYVLASNNPVFNVSALTACVWVNLANLSTNPIAFARADSAFGSSGMWSISSDLTPEARIYAGSSVTLTSNTFLSVGAWTHLCLTYDGANAVLYQNGTIVASQPLTGSLGPLSVPVSMGALSGGTQPFDGRIDEAQLYSRALTANEIKALYQAQNAGVSSGLYLNVTPGTSQTTAFDAVVQTSAPGYTLAINQDHALTSGSYTIPSVGGSIASPLAWNEGSTKGLGFTLYGTNATAIPGTWTSGSSYAAIPASSTSFYTRTGYTGGTKDTLNMRVRLDVASSQPTASYSNQMTITGTMTP